MSRADVLLAAAPRAALHKPFAAWLAEDSTPCPRCSGPRDAHAGCDHCRERAGSAARLLIDLNTEPTE